MKKIISLLLFLILTASSLAETISGKVIAVKDGDTIEILVDNRPVRIRLNGIDCPEKSQPFGNNAKQFTSELAYNKTVMANVQDKDRYGRLVCDVVLPDKRVLNHELVRAGLAWHYKQYSQDAYLAKLEREARSSGIGLWSDKNLTAPWEFRRSQRTGGNFNIARSETNNSRCQALTKKGTQCKRKALQGSKYCRQHNN